jgi:hypothetical protein
VDARHDGHDPEADRSGAALIDPSIDGALRACIIPIETRVCHLVTHLVGVDDGVWVRIVLVDVEDDLPVDGLGEVAHRLKTHSSTHVDGLRRRTPEVEVGIPREARPRVEVGEHGSVWAFRGQWYMHSRMLSDRGLPAALPGRSSPAGASTRWDPTLSA